jgi:hypothetical protein
MLPLFILLAETKLLPFSCLGIFCPNSDASDSGTQLENILTTVVSFLTVIAGLSFLIFFIVGALNWVTAGGDKGKVDTAKMTMTNGAIGMIAVVAAYAIVWIVGSVLGIDILNPAKTLFGPGSESVTPNIPANTPNFMNNYIVPQQP